ncbi:MAG: 16S rRNA (guanine(527)-N(7))-methyltransferase RsmG [Gammaproteobacteria bacterium]|nr:16S rRNA (guanine(527)-N(7))-methyltransferase RsmG [Gammaproteobacteria bacterium]
MDVGQRLREGLAQLGMPADAVLVGQLAGYLGLLEQWNRAYNLTRVTGLDDMAVRHILDSVTARPWLAGSRILDAGTGAGLPGIPLALLEPARRFTLVDSVGKKMRFLHQAVASLGLRNVTLLQARLEDCPAGSADTVVSRALASLADFVGSCGRLVAPGGRLVAMKGRRPDEELAVLPAPWRATTVGRVAVPGLDAERHIVVLER